MNTIEILQGIKDWAAPKVIYDISAAHNNTKYADLSAALGTNGGNIPQEYRKGGITVRFVRTSDNNYVQARCTAQNFTTDVTQWQGVDKEITADSPNLIESGDVYKRVRELGTKANSIYGDYFLDLSHSWDSTLNIYKISPVFDTAWVGVLEGSSKISVSGATVTSFRFFSSFDPIYDNTIERNTTGYVPNGAKLVHVLFRKSDNPGGYSNLEIKQDNNLLDMVDNYFPRGLNLHPNHLMNEYPVGVITYSPNVDWDCFSIMLSGQSKVNVDGKLPETYYRFFSDSDIFTDNEDITSLQIASNTTGAVPEGAVMCTISVRKTDYPNGYGNFRLINTYIYSPNNMFCQRGYYIEPNHIMNVSGDGTSFRYVNNTGYDSLIIRLNGEKKITLRNKVGGKYRFFSSDNIFSGDNVISYHLDSNDQGYVPDGAAICTVALKKTDYPNGYDNLYLENEFEGTKTIRLLLIGNSASDDAMSYVPFIMNNMGINVNYQIGILMRSSATLQVHVNNFENDNSVYGFRLYNGRNSWSVGSEGENGVSIQWALDNYEWDIISLQQAGPQYPDTYQPYCQKLINLISNYIDYPVKFIWYQTQIYAAQTNSGPARGDETINQYYAQEVSACQNIIGSTIFEYVVPVSTAIQNARTILALKTMGDYANNPNNTTGYGYLNANDGVHLQEGLPCQIAAYTWILAILDIYGLKEHSINGETTRVTSEWSQGKNIPSPHGNPIGSTDENCLIVQKCAIMAVKHPYEVTDMNYIVNPT